MNFFRAFHIPPALICQPGVVVSSFSPPICGGVYFVRAIHESPVQMAADGTVARPGVHWGFRTGDS
jgi:hypothetical protein